MSAWIWVLIPIIAIIGGYIIDYQKNKLKWQNQTSSNEADLEEIRVIMQQMKKRIENLEAIAVHDTGDFPNAGKESYQKIEIDDHEEISDKHRSEVERMAKNKGE
ncbi:hypothetical protein BH23BAC3_BH23BAC3_35280 [soil metagenome]